jgi:rhodanese-related sulfurtransferase
VTIEEGKAAFDSAAAVFVDVRSQTQYDRGHIAGALSIPLDQIVEGRTEPLDPNSWIITYCT